MTKRLIIDLAACDRCDGCSVGPAMLALRERATFELVCRRCEHASCVQACPFDALERSEEGIIKRHNMRCVSCKSCSLACPFGTIYMELLPFYSMSYEAAVGSLVGAAKAAIGADGDSGSRRATALHKRSFACGKTALAPSPALSPLQLCKQGALDYREVLPDEKNIHIIDGFLAARARRWDKSDRAEEAA